MAPTSFVLVLSPSAVSSVIVVRVNLLVNNMRSFLMIVVVELSNTKGIPSISHEDVLSLGRNVVADILIFMVGIELYHFRWFLPCLTRML